MRRRDTCAELIKSCGVWSYRNLSICYLTFITYSQWERQGCPRRILIGRNYVIKESLLSTQVRVFILTRPSF